MPAEPLPIVPAMELLSELYDRRVVCFVCGRLRGERVGVEMGLEEVLIPPLLRAGQMAVAMHFDAGEETRHRRACVPLSFRQRRRPAAANLSILILL